MSESLSANRAKRREWMLEGPVVRVLLIVALPTILTMIIDSFYNIADAYFVSQLGTAATGAVGINDSLSQIIRAVSLGFGMGTSSYISRLMGAKQEDEASCVGTTMLITAVFAMFLLSVLALIFVEPLVILFGSTESTKEYSIDYARLILAAAPFTAGEVMLGQLLRAEGSTGYSMIGMVSGCIINVVLDPIFITLFALEVSGAALATGISKIISFCILLLPFVYKKTLLEVKPSFFTPKREIYKEVAKVGVPVFLRSSMLGVATIVTNNVAGFFGNATLAASAIANRCIRLVSAAIQGFGQGFQPVAGYCWGAKRYKRVKEAFWVCSVIGVIAVIILGTAMIVVAPALVGAFAKDDKAIISIGTVMLRAQCITMAPHIWVIIVNGLFQALGKGITAGFLGLSRQLICFVPVLFVMSTLFSVNGFMISQAVADILCVIVACPLVVKLMREINAAKEEEE